MLPNSPIFIFEAMQSLVEERIARAQRRAEIHSLMQETRARKQFRRSIAHGLRKGLSEKDLAAELCSSLRTQARN
ncbi:MAG: hypothetical protein WBC63_08810 [Candidatus Bipolaricaulia bacterium]